MNGALIHYKGTRN
jgi:hypothetical protein